MSSGKDPRAERLRTGRPETFDLKRLYWPTVPARPLVGGGGEKWYGSVAGGTVDAK